MAETLPKALRRLHLKATVRFEISDMHNFLSWLRVGYFDQDGPSAFCTGGQPAIASCPTVQLSLNKPPGATRWSPSWLLLLLLGSWQALPDRRFLFGHLKAPEKRTMCRLWHGGVSQDQNTWWHWCCSLAHAISRGCLVDLRQIWQLFFMGQMWANSLISLPIRTCQLRCSLFIPSHRVSWILQVFFRCSHVQVAAP